MIGHVNVRLAKRYVYMRVEILDTVETLFNEVMIRVKLFR